MKKKLAIISSHPIQYNAPLFTMLANSEKLELKVFYTWSQSKDSLFDKDFGKTIQWDIPLLEGYPYEFTDNVSKNPGPGSFLGIVCPSLNTHITEWGAEALLVYGWNYHAHYYAMRHFKGRIPVSFRGDSTLLDESGGIKAAIRRMILKYVYRSADFAFYVGENSRQYFLKHGFSKDHLFFAPHAIDNRRFSDPSGRMSLEAEQWRTELGIRTGDIAVLFVGKFEAKKNPLLLIQSAVKLNKKGVHYLFVGNGHLEQQMKDLTAGKSQFHFIPFQNQSRMPAVYFMSDILALPSQGPGETWGLVVNEAMACGKAVLVSDKSGCAINLVEQGKNGYILASGDVEQCVELLDKMTASAEIAREMGKISKKIISDWSFEAECKSFEDHIFSSIK
ncbi:MAG: glycosyltransferase family 4 protein [Bacteroidales bacterium]